MSEGAIKKIRFKFIVVAMASLITTMTLIAGMLYFGNLLISRREIHNTLNYIIENNGELITWDEKEATVHSKQYIRFLEDIFETNKNIQSSDFRYTTRYFAILYDQFGQVADVKTSHISDITESEAERYGALAKAQSHRFGRIDNYYYQVGVRNDGTSIVVYLDSAHALQINNRLLYMALTLIGFGMLITFLLVRAFSFRIIRKEIKNAELQKQFMTNASHELKTPLAVIRANTEMTEMLEGSNEWTESTMRQIDRMNGLIQNLVMITRADENHSHANLEDVDITRAITETVNNFRSLAIQGNKTMTESINENVHMRAEDAQIRQLCSLLVDNAIKYCDENGEIEISLAQKGKGIVLSVSNSYADGANVDYTKFFERFYREDESHNTDRGGYGIGLSIAESLAKQYKGNINVSWKKGIIQFNCFLKPAHL